MFGISWKAIALVVSIVVFARLLRRHRLRCPWHFLLAAAVIAFFLITDPWRIFGRFHFWQPFGGIVAFFNGPPLAALPALIIGIALAALLLRIYRYPIAPYLGALAPTLALGMMIGRAECWSLGDGDYGYAAGFDFFPITVQFSRYYIAPTHGVPVWNTPFLEMLLLLIFTWYAITKARRELDADILLHFVVYYSIVRFALEFLRLHDAFLPLLEPPPVKWNIAMSSSSKLTAAMLRDWHWYGLTHDQVIALLTMIGAALLFFSREPQSTMKLSEAIARNPRRKIFRVISRPLEGPPDNWDLEVVRNPTLKAIPGIYIIRAVQILEANRSADCFMELHMNARESKFALFTNNGNVVRVALEDLRGDVIPTVGIESPGDFLLYYSNIQPLLSIQLLNIALTESRNNAHIALDLSKVCRKAGYAKMAIRACRIALFNTAKRERKQLHEELASLYASVGEERRAKYYASLAAGARLE